MFRDREEALRRLQEQLLEDQAQETAQEPEEQSPEDGQEELCGDAGKVVTGYRAYNTDRVDEDLEDFSRRVMEPPAKGRGWKVAAGFLLLAAAVLMLLWLLARREGLV